MTSASRPPKKIDSENRISVVGTALSRVTIVEARKVKSIVVSLRLAHGRCRHAAVGAPFRAVENAIRKAGQDQIETAAGDEEEEVLPCRARRHLAGAHQFGKAGDGDQRRILEAELPDV